MTISEMQKNIDNLIKLYFNQPRVLYEHLFNSYHQFVEEIIPYSLIQEKNYFYENVDKETIYLHGFKCSNVRIKPSTFENDNEIKFPSDARKNHLNYFGSIVADIQQFVEIINSVTGNKSIKMIGSLEKETPIANIPIMVKSKYCSTHIKQDLKGECKFDPGGYFIVNGSEKVVMSIEKMVDNKVLVFTKKDPSYENGLIYTAQINSKRNDWSDNLQILTIKTRKDGVLTVSTSSQLVDVPLFILMRALGVEADQNIISHITYDLDDIKMLNLIRPSVSFSMDDEGTPIKSKEEAIEYLITRLKRNKRISQTDEEVAKIQKRMYLDKILRQDLLPHLGEDINKKIVFLGYMANKLINVMLGRQSVDDRDALQNKRVETPGILLGQLFRQNWKKMLNEIGKHFKKKNQSDENPINVISQIKPSVIEQGLKTALATGVWGINKTKNGVAQSLQRLSWIKAISDLRRISSPTMDESTSKVTSIRHVNNNQVQLLCCLTGDTEIVLENGIDTVLIKDILNNYCVSTVNPDTLEETPSTIYNKFGRLADKLYEIITVSGRVIKATPDHKFLINVNGIPTWKRVDNLSIGDNFIVRHTQKYIEPDDYEFKVVPQKYSIYNDYVKSISINNKKLLSIARLVSLLTANSDILSCNTRGYISVNNNIYSLYIIIKDNYNDRLVDIKAIIYDLNVLGFNISLDDLLTNSSNDECHIRIENSPLIYYLSLLISSPDIVPDWIMTSPKNIKREYLSVFFSKYGKSIKLENNSKTNYTLNYNQGISINNIIELVNDIHIDYTVKRLSQISKLLKDFNISTTVKLNHISNVHNCSNVELSFNNTEETLTNFIDYIGFNYNRLKALESAKAIETFKSSSTGYLSELSSIGNMISVPIKSIRELEPEMIYDFTTVSNNHSFVASSIVSSNCFETPEGAKIGIVKSLAMMASVSSQNSTQSDIIKNIFKKNKYIKHPYDIDPLYMNDYVKIFINGDWIGVVKLSNAFDIFNMLKQKRRENIIEKQTSISLDTGIKELKIYFDGGRLIRPVLVVNNNKVNITENVIKDINELVSQKDKSKAWKEVISKYSNLVDYEDIESLNYLMVSDSVDKLELQIKAKESKVEYTDETQINRYGDYRWVNYTHCDFHAWVMLGSVVGNIPFSNHNYGLRNIIHFSQAKQSISLYLSSYKDRMDISQVLWHPQVPLVQTQGMQYNNCLDLPHGENAVVAVCSYTGLNH